MSRAGFLRTCGAIVAGRGLDPLSVFAFADGPAAAATGPAALPAGGFHAHVGTSALAIDASGARVPLTLAAVSDVRACGPFEQYAVTFHAGPGASFTEGIYTVRHAALGEMELFIAPVGGPAGKRMVCEACFSRPAARDAGGDRD
jgi:hypothetical protein